jgi:hypothetical protein
MGLCKDYDVTAQEVVSMTNQHVMKFVTIHSGVYCLSAASSCTELLLTVA